MSTRSVPLTQGLDVADVNGDNKLDILVGTVDPGVGGLIRIFEFDGQRGFEEHWVSDKTAASNIPGFSSGDLDGDGLKEFVYNGNEIYGYNRIESKYELRGTLSIANSGQTAIGVLPALQEPSNGVRIVPVRWTLPRGSLRLGESAEVSISFRSVWATAKDVVMEVATDTPDLVVKNGTVRIGEILGGQIVASPTFSVEAPRPASPAQAGKEAVGTGTGNLILAITAAGGYRQTIPLRVSITQK